MVVFITGMSLQNAQLAICDRLLLITFPIYSDKYQQLHL